MTYLPVLWRSVGRPYALCDAPLVGARPPPTDTTAPEIKCKLSRWPLANMVCLVQTSEGDGAG